MPAQLRAQRPDPRQTSGTPVLAFISDTQMPTWIESLWLRRHDNEEARAALFSEITQDPTLAALFHLGDITEAGSSDAAWKGIDDARDALSRARLPLYPAFGNHEYMWSGSDGLKNFRARFPWCEPSWYTVRVGSIAVVLLNSNLSELGESRIAAQNRWFSAVLSELDKDKGIQAVIVGLHHSPYTNSSIVSPSVEVQAHFVPPYLASRKAVLFVSGHAHTCEHFNIHGKNFLVIGGGGGLLQPVLTGTQQRYRDLTPFTGSRRPFHFMKCRMDGDSLRVSIHMRRRSTGRIGVPYRIAIPLPR